MHIGARRRASSFGLPVAVAALLVAPCLTGRSEAEDLDPGYRLMYNLQFEEAHRLFADWERLHPDDPLGPASDAAAYLFSEFDRLKILQAEFFTDDDRFLARRRPAADPMLKQRFESALERTRVRAERVLARAPRDRNALFASLLRHGLRSDYLGLIEKRYMASFTEMKRGRKYAEQLLAIDPTYYDAYVAIGVENYLLSQRSAPVRWLLRLGGGQVDKAQGLAKLRLTSEKGRYLMPFARLLLAVAALRDKDRKQARNLLAGLAAEFPRNRLYAEELGRLN